MSGELCFGTGQNTQNRDFRILQLKLTELLRVSEDSLLLNVERFSDDELGRLEEIVAGHEAVCRKYVGRVMDGDGKKQRP